MDNMHMELINFLIERYYLSLPLLIVIFLLIYSSSTKGGKKISPQFLISLANNEVYEFSPETNMIFDKIIKILLQNKGYFLLIDYGYYSSPKISTLQSIKDNKKTNILDNPGNQDITYHVDFDNFKNILLKKNILNHRIISQAKFLFENGIKERTQVLIDSNPSKMDKGL